MCLLSHWCRFSDVNVITSDLLRQKGAELRATDRWVVAKLWHNPSKLRKRRLKTFLTRFRLYALMAPYEYLWSSITGT